MPQPGAEPIPLSGQFYSTWGPCDGPILGAHEPPALGVVDAPGAIWPIGIAYPVGLVAHRRGPATTFRLIIRKVELEGRWLCVARQFLRLGDAAEPL
jgi:hypothetical protein